MRHTADPYLRSGYLAQMDHKARMVFRSGALVLTLVSACATAHGAAIYENHFDVYRVIATKESPQRDRINPPVRKAQKHAPAKLPPVVLSDTVNGRWTTDARPGSP